jgi:hypothetical protein
VCSRVTDMQDRLGLLVKSRLLLQTSHTVINDFHAGV